MDEATDRQTKALLGHYLDAYSVVESEDGHGKDQRTGSPALASMANPLNHTPLSISGTSYDEISQKRKVLIERLLREREMMRSLPCTTTSLNDPSHPTTAEEAARANPSLQSFQSALSTSTQRRTDSLSNRLSRHLTSVSTRPSVETRIKLWQAQHAAKVKQREEEKRRREEAESEAYPFKPTLPPGPIQQPKEKPDELYERLYRDHAERLQAIEAMTAMKAKQERDNESTFQPELSKASRAMIEQVSGQKENEERGGSQVFERLASAATVATASRIGSLRSQEDICKSARPRSASRSRSRSEAHAKLDLTSPDDSSSPMSTSSPTSSVCAHNVADVVTRMEALHHEAQERLLRLKMEEAAKAAKECTFAPKLSSKTQKIVSKRLGGEEAEGKQRDISEKIARFVERQEQDRLERERARQEAASRPVAPFRPMLGDQTDKILGYGHANCIEAIRRGQSRKTETGSDSFPRSTYVGETPEERAQRLAKEDPAVREEKIERLRMEQMLSMPFTPAINRVSRILASKVRRHDPSRATEMVKPVTVCDGNLESEPPEHSIRIAVHNTGQEDLLSNITPSITHVVNDLAQPKTVRCELLAEAERDLASQCTFAPTLCAVSQVIVSALDDSRRVSLVSEAKEKSVSEYVQGIKERDARKEQQRAEEVKQREERELKECTFAPRLISRPASAPRLRRTVEGKHDDKDAYPLTKPLPTKPPSIPVAGLKRLEELRRLKQQQEYEKQEREKKVFGFGTPDSRAARMGIVGPVTIPKPFPLSTAPTGQRDKQRMLKESLVEKEKQLCTFTPRTKIREARDMITKILASTDDEAVASQDPIESGKRQNSGRDESVWWDFGRELEMSERSQDNGIINDSGRRINQSNNNVCRGEENRRPTSALSNPCGSIPLSTHHEDENPNPGTSRGLIQPTGRKNTYGTVPLHTTEKKRRSSIEETNDVLAQAEAALQQSNAMKYGFQIG